jgi:ABC-type Na+ transport system ATPase subunit NatA
MAMGVFVSRKFVIKRYVGMSPPEKNMEKTTNLRRILFTRRKGFDRGYAKRIVKARAIMVPPDVYKKVFL